MHHRPNNAAEAKNVSLDQFWRVPTPVMLDNLTASPRGLSSFEAQNRLLRYDPPKPDAAQAISRLAASGVRIKLLSGDSISVASHLASLVGMPGIDHRHGNR
jgi:hypothetical protein